MVTHDAANADEISTMTIQAEIQQWRLQLLNSLLIGIFVLAGPLIIVASLSFMRDLPQVASLVIAGFVIAYLIGGVITFVRQIPYIARAATLLVLFYVVGTYDVVAYGLMSDGRIYLLIVVIMAALLVGMRTAAVLAGLVIATLVGLAWGLHRWAPSPIPATPNPELWITVLISLALHIIALLVCIAFLLGRLTDALRTSRVALRQAEASASEARNQAEALAEQTRRLEEAERSLRSLVKTLEAPAVDIAEHVVLTPIIGTVDTTRIQAITDRLLHVVHTRSIRLVILDVAGMPDADVASIEALQSTAAALRLLGCRVVFTGFSPTVALTFQQTGIIVDTMEIRRSPQDVLMENLTR